MARSATPLTQARAAARACVSVAAPKIPRRSSPRRPRCLAPTIPRRLRAKWTWQRCQLGALEMALDRRFEPAVVVAGHQVDAPQPAILQPLKSSW